MAEIVNIKVKVEDHGKAMSQVIALKNNIDYINSHHINVQVDNANQLEQITRKMTAYNNSVARRVKAETQLATAIEYRKAEESKAQAQHERTLQAEQRTIQAQERTTQAVERTAQAETRLAIEQERTAQAAERTAQSENKLAIQQERTAQVAAKEAAAQERAKAAKESAIRPTNQLGVSLASLVTRVFSLHMAMSRVVSMFREALSTMKEVDSELVTIQKTTGFTGDQLDKLTESAYGLANAYGRTATEILNAASVYARAGFKDNLNQMTELSALLQNVGDLEGETASKFLIATNAAWKLKGSYDALMSVLDGLNAQTNQAAVDMEALTSGITVAGSVFAAAGETVQTFAGMLGAGVALTARSGSEIGRGLRTIAMNIRQIKGELDDGEIVDDESISDAAKALHSIGISVADANGELRLTSQVLDELAGKWGELTSAEQSYIAQSLAGKRQANILIALMQNWDEAQRQMTLYAEGAGSALKENEIYMNSWEAKTKQLSAAWTRFVNDLVDTDLIKGSLDALIKFVNLLDTKLGRLLITSGGIAAAFVSVVSIVGKLSAAITTLNAVMAVNPIFLAVAGVTAGTYLLVDAFNSIKTKSEQLAEAVQETQQAYESITAEVDELKSREEELTELEREKLALLEEQARLKKEAADAAKREQALYNYQSQFSGTLEASGYMGTYNAYQRKKETATWEEFKVIEARMHEIEARAEREGATQQARRLITQHGGLISSMSKANTADEFNEIEASANEAYEAIVDMAVELTEMSEILGEEMPENGALALRMLNAYISNMRTAKKETADTADVAEETAEDVDELRIRLKALSDEADSADTAIGGVVEAIEKFGDGSVELYDAMRVLESTIPGSTRSLYDFETAALKVDAAQFADKQSLLDLIDAERQVNFQNAIDQMNAVADAAWNMWAAEAMAFQGLTGDDLLRAGEWFNGGTQEGINAIIKQRQEWDAWITTLRERSDYQTTTTSRTSTTTASTDPELARRQGIVALRKSELEFLKASGASNDKIAAKEKEIQAALHTQAEYMRGILATMEAEGKTQAEIDAYQANINALSTEWWNIEKNIQSLNEEILKTQQELFNTLQATIDKYYDAAVTDKEKELSLEEKILEVQKAQIALQNAKNERNVRYFNAATGQWEWGANQKNVQAAEDALKKAQQSLNDYQKEQAWSEFKSAWEYVADQIKAGSMTFAEAYDYMYKRMTEIQDKYDVDMSAVLEDSIGGFRGLNITINELDKETADQLAKSVGLIKERTDNLRNAMSEFQTAFDEMAEKIKSGEITLDDAFQYLKDKAKAISEKYGIDMTGALDEAIAGMDKTQMSIEDLWKQTVIARMKANSVAWFDAADSEKAALHAENQVLAQLIGADYDKSGYWSINGRRIYDPTDGKAGGSGSASSGASTGGSVAVSGGGVSTNIPAAAYNASDVPDTQIINDIVASAKSGNTDWADVASGALQAGKRPVVYDANGVPTGILSGSVGGVGTTFTIVDGKVLDSGLGVYRQGTISVTDTNGTVWNVDPKTGKLYDNGGILHGVGGIKATARDEMILPPDITDMLLSPTSNHLIRTRMDDLRCLLGARPEAGSVDRSIGTQNNGDNYVMNGVSISEQQARSMTVYDLAQVARSLGSYKHGN